MKIPERIHGIPVKVQIVTPSGEKNVRTFREMAPVGLTIHNTGNSGKGTGAATHAKYLQNVERDDTRYVSWHFTVDAKEIIQHLPLNEMGIHAGDYMSKAGSGNNSTIGIEIAEPADQDYAVCEANAIKLIAFLMQQFDWDVMAVKPHRFYALNKKLCPYRILKSEQHWKNNWRKFQDRIMKVYTELYKKFDQYLVRVTADSLNIRSGPTNKHKVVGQIRNKGVYTIVETSGSWGKLKSGVGWIHLGYTVKM